MKFKISKLLSILSLLSAGIVAAQKFEAESGVLTPGDKDPAELSQCATCSGGKSVNTKETGFSLTINVAKDTKYNVYIYVASPYGPKTNTVKIDDLSVDFTVDSVGNKGQYTKVKIMSNLKLTAGDHLLTFSKSWGWVFVDYFELEEAQATTSSKLEAEDGTMISAASNGASVLPCATCSGGASVETKESGFTIDANILKEGNYNVYMYVASPNGQKTNTFTVDKGKGNGLSVDFLTSDSGYIKLKVISNIKLAAGTHTFGVEKSWGWISVDYIELEQTAGSQLDISDTLVTKNPSPEALCLYKYLKQSYGKSIISGVMTLHPFDETDSVKTRTGKEPVLMGLDFMWNNAGAQWYDEKENINTAKGWAAKNGIVTITWHWRDPLRKTLGFYVPDGIKKPEEVTDFDVSKINDPNSPEYIAMIKDIDTISMRLKEFRDNKIPVLWRPLHEAAGGWFWWGAKSGADLQKLWRIMFDRMVNVHGLNNLIWVWTNQGNDSEWYPGDKYVDIVGVDVYQSGDHGSQILKFNNLNDQYAGKKMLALTEVGAAPDDEKLVGDEAPWAWFMTWYGNYNSGNDPNWTPWSLWTKLANSTYVTTLDEMPLIDASCKTISPVLDYLSSEGILVYPTITDGAVNIESQNESSLKVSIYNALGGFVMERNIKSNSVSLDISKFSEGLYFVVINGKETVKITKR